MFLNEFLHKNGNVAGVNSFPQRLAIYIPTFLQVIKASWVLTAWRGKYQKIQLQRTFHSIFLHPFTCIYCAIVMPIICKGFYFLFVLCQVQQGCNVWNPIFCSVGWRKKIMYIVLGQSSELTSTLFISNGFSDISWFCPYVVSVCLCIAIFVKINQIWTQYAPSIYVQPVNSCVPK